MEDYPESVISAIYEQCSDNKDEIAETLKVILNETQELRDACREWLIAHDRCIYCGSKLQVVRGKEYHSEVDAYEPYCEKYCPICDLGG
jgi:uncharacterized protein with PIN domain